MNKSIRLQIPKPVAHSDDAQKTYFILKIDLLDNERVYSTHTEICHKPLL